MILFFSFFGCLFPLFVHFFGTWMGFKPIPTFYIFPTRCPNPPRPLLEPPLLLLTFSVSDFHGSVFLIMSSGSVIWSQFFPLAPEAPQIFFPVIHLHHRPGIFYILFCGVRSFFEFCPVFILSRPRLHPIVGFLCSFWHPCDVPLRPVNATKVGLKKNSSPSTYPRLSSCHFPSFSVVGFNLGTSP